MLQGASWGLTVSPLVVGGLGEVPGRLLGQASAVRSLAQQVGGAVGVAALTAVVTSGSNAHATGAEAWNSYSVAYCVAAGASIVAAVVAMQLSNHVERRPHDVAADGGVGEEAVIAALE